jgi:hypothetical protein
MECNVMECNEMKWNGMVREWIFLRPCGFNKDEWCQMVMKLKWMNEWMNARSLIYRIKCISISISISIMKIEWNGMKWNGMTKRGLEIKASIKESLRVWKWKCIRLR